MAGGAGAGGRPAKDKKKAGTGGAGGDLDWGDIVGPKTNPFTA